MASKMEKFWGAFFGTLILLSVGFGLVFLTDYCVMRFGPFVIMPVVAISVAAFAGLMHATSDGEKND